MNDLENKLKEEFHAEFGCEDTFRLVAKTEINAAKGIMKITEINLQGEEVVSESNIIDVLVCAVNSTQ